MGGLFPRPGSCCPLINTPRERRLNYLPRSRFCNKTAVKFTFLNRSVVFVLACGGGQKGAAWSYYSQLCGVHFCVHQACAAAAPTSCCCVCNACGGLRVWHVVLVQAHIVLQVYYTMGEDRHTRTERRRDNAGGICIHLPSCTQKEAP